MADTRLRRDEIADGVAVGQAEVLVATKQVTVRGGRVKRPWRQEERPRGMTGAALDAWARSMALRYPQNVAA
jgi:hypothetical protein